MLAVLAPARRLREDPLDVRCGARVGVEAVQPPSPSGVLNVRVRPGIDQTVAVGWATAQVPALGAGLGAHRRVSAPPGTEDLPFGLMTEEEQQRLVGGVGQVDRAVELGHPHGDPVGVQLGDDGRAWPRSKARSNSPITTASKSRS
jgi:hypothetical protein